MIFLSCVLYAVIFMCINIPPHLKIFNSSLYMGLSIDR